MGIIRGLIGLAFIGGVGLLLSSNRKEIRYKNIALMIIIQLVLTFLLLNTSVGLTALGGVSEFFSWLIGQGTAGVDFVFGGIEIAEGATVFFLHVLMPLVFISALIGILDYLGILNFIIKWVGWIINKITGMGELESYMPVATTLLGSPQVFITIKDTMPNLNANQLFTVCMTVISSASASMLASYMTMLEGQYVVMATFLNFFSGLIIAGLLNPYTSDVASIEKLEIEEEVKERQPFFEMLGEYISSGFDLAVIVAAMVIGFISLITFLNNSMDLITGITFTQVLGYILAPVAWLIGIPKEDIVRIGSVMASKLLTNEFVAMGEIVNLKDTLSEKSIAMISVYTISFANFGTLGIISGAVKAISGEKAKDVAKFSLKLILGGTMAGLLTATIVGFFF
ncbi:nucleoside transporter C-terminal domain-containing protein [Aerococcus sp. UMB8487]|uniref:NupC/NupG family nucleoside CNT transporter n=1 Tax=Aerococcus sp. UMB8487 TaxID=3046346 RepID=UPI00254B134C|nr:nucleoside transporter C-terminal domain-containing protein [Aerococcus sp. UMB8487]MDK6939941.1 nucleoside transporter C-terminal domain-containing protein [Aerococcus sp. UMB8487]